jgi:hypothetical protein
MRGNEKIPIHGGPGDPEGQFNAINVSWSGDPDHPGFTNVPHGSSFVMVTSFNGGCPDDRSILTYSESENPNSPYFADQTEMFSKKQWVDPPFCASEVDNNPNLTNQVIQGCLPEGCGNSGGAGGPATNPNSGTLGAAVTKPRKKKCRAKAKKRAAGCKKKRH